MGPVGVLSAGYYLCGVGRYVPRRNVGYEGYYREEGSGSENMVGRKGRAEAAAGDKGTGHTYLGKLFLKLSRYE